VTVAVAAVCRSASVGWDTDFVRIPPTRTVPSLVSTRRCWCQTGRTRLRQRDRRRYRTLHDRTIPHISTGK